MKIRSGFVSNSSSSSFILLVPDAGGDVCPHCKRGNPAFLDIFPEETDDYSNTKVHAVGSDDILSQFGSEGDSIRKGIEKALEKHPNWSPVYCSVDYCDEGLNRRIIEMANNGEIVMIENMS